ncbi:hAT transposon superfamily [Euphorbia peplus]|nr:hAT transposon superfamily [Euphorbia peplus]
MDSNLEEIPITSQKHDPAWKHCQMFKNGDKVQLMCLYCGKVFKGGGIHRIKEHLAGQKGNASTCLHVPSDVKMLMQESLDGVVVRKKKKQKIAEEISNLNPCGSEIDVFVRDELGGNLGVEVVEVLNLVEPCLDLCVSRGEGTVSKGGTRRKRGRQKGVTLDNRAVLGPKRANEHVHMAIGRFLYDIGASLDAVNSAYFQPMVDAIASGGSKVGMPSCHDLRGWILKNTVEEVKGDIDRHVAVWARTGCSILVDQWDTLMGRILLSFLVYSPEGVVFLKSTDASEFRNSPDALYELLKQVVEDVGVGHVLQVITRMEEQYIVMGRRLMDTFPTLYWAPCAAHCLDLILEDFSKLEWINTVIQQARSMTRFIYNHSMVLNMMRRYTCGNDIVEIGITRFSANFATLKRILDLKQALQTMVTSQEWMDCPYSQKPGGLEMLDLLLSSQSFWSSCELITRLTNSLLRLLRIVISNKKPAMGYVYAGFYRAKEAIKKELVKSKDYIVYWNIIDHWWDQQNYVPFHTAGFFLNPKFFYSIEGGVPNEITSGMFECIEKLVPDVKIRDKITKEMNSYKTAAGDFGRKMAVRARDVLLPAEWWSTYGGSCPDLMRLAIRILSQTCSSIGYKQNQIPVEQIYDTKNFLERQRLNDVVYVQYNLRLKQMVCKSEEDDSMDPISFDRSNILEDWVKEKDLSSEDYADSNWMALVPTSADRSPLGPSRDEAEEFYAGFDDYEILNRVKYSDEQSAEENH